MGEVKKIYCPACGGKLRYMDSSHSVCPYCGNEYVFAPGNGDALEMALARADALRMQNDFEGAATEYRLITEKSPRCADAWWGLTLSLYGVEYVEDPYTDRRIPVCHRCVKAEITECDSYKNAMRTAPADRATEYAKRAEAISALQKSIKEKLKDEKPCDVFLCYRSEDDSGAPTRERQIGRKIYDELTSRGISTFYADISLRGRLGEEYEPLIYNALYTCRFFILIVCSEENMESAWVKNEWERFRDRMYEERLSDCCFAVFENMSPSALPSFLRTQGINLSRYPAGGYETEIADGISVRLKKGRNSKAPITVFPDGEEYDRDTGKFIQKGNRALKKGDYVTAAAAFSQAIEADPDNADAWFGAFFAETETQGIATFADELCDRLYDKGATYEECAKRLQSNEKITASLCSPYYRNALQYAHGTDMDRLVTGKKHVFDTADLKNAGLRSCMQTLSTGQQQTADTNTAQQSSDGKSGIDPTSAALGAAAGAATVGALGWAVRPRRRWWYPYDDFYGPYYGRRGGYYRGGPGGPGGRGGPGGPGGRGGPGGPGGHGGPGGGGHGGPGGGGHGGGR